MLFLPEGLEHHDGFSDGMKSQKSIHKSFSFTVSRNCDLETMIFLKMMPLRELGNPIVEFTVH